MSRYNIVLNAIAKSGGKGAAEEAEKLLQRMHDLHERGDPDVKPNVVSYGAVIDCFSKCGDPDAASRADNLLASMIKLHQSDTIRHADLLPNTYVFNCWYVRCLVSTVLRDERPVHSLRTLDAVSIVGRKVKSRMLLPRLKRC